MKRFVRLLVLAIPLLLEMSCNSTDCPLSNVVRAYYAVYSSKDGASTTISDTLSIMAANTTLLNKATSTSSFNLPMGYVNSQDTLYFKFANSNGSATDTIVVSHTNTPHFVSLDCGTAIFHTVTNVSWNKRVPTEAFPNAIDSIVVSKNTINYDQTENFKVYIGTL